MHLTVELSGNLFVEFTQSAVCYYLFFIIMASLIMIVG